jgi:hypothetical protein
VIRFLDQPDPESPFVEFVGGPRAGEREELVERPTVIDLAEGRYVRSARCADDGALRYVWVPVPRRGGRAADR